MRTHRTLDLRASCTGAAEAEPVQLAATADEAAVLRYLLVKPFEKFWRKLILTAFLYRDTLPTPGLPPYKELLMLKEKADGSALRRC